ncbi:MAG: FtsX-like permease family protein [Bacteroidota bacterium]
MFGSGEAVGKTVSMNNAEFVITGVIKNIPENTHIRFEMLVSFSTFYKRIPENWTSNRGWMAPFTYVYVQPGQLNSVVSKMGDFQAKFYETWDTPENLRSKVMLELQPLKDIHLKSHMEQEMGENSNESYLYIFAAVALFIIFIASVNFINLNISLAFRRMKETGLRKVMGAVRGQLIKQYLAETLVISTVALLLALCLFFAVIPNYNSLAGRDVQMSDILTLGNMTIMIGLVVGVALLSGAYPAFFMSKYKPTDALKSQKGPGGSAPLIRKSLVVFQFAVSAFMIASTIIIIRQMNYFQNQDLGFNKDHVISVSLYGELSRKIDQSPDAVKSELRKDPSILNIGLTSNLPGEGISVEGVVPEGTDPNAQLPTVRVIRADEGMIETLQIPIVEGRGFSSAYNDSASFIVNKAALKALNITDAIGTRLVNQSNGNLTGPIVGVVDDYHFSSLHNSVDPLVLEYRRGSNNNMLLKVNTSNMSATLKNIENTLRSIAPSNMFLYNFYEDKVLAAFSTSALAKERLHVLVEEGSVVECQLFALSY